MVSGHQQGGTGWEIDISGTITEATSEKDLFVVVVVVGWMGGMCKVIFVSNQTAVKADLWLRWG